MSLSSASSRVPGRLLGRLLGRLSALLAGALTVGLIAAPAAHAVNPTAHLTLPAGQSGSIGRVTSNTDVTPVATCDPELSISYAAELNGTVTVAPGAAAGSYSCTVDFQLDGQSTGLVQDVVVDVVPTAFITDVAVNEGDPATSTSSTAVSPDTGDPPTPGDRFTFASFTVRLSGPSPDTVTMIATTADGTATTADPDYAPVDTTVTFPPGTTGAPVSVVVTRDTVREADETFSVDLSAPGNAVIVDGQGVCTILNDDNGRLGG
ncbi:MAG TPA: Calx-beta domain-containing protein [Mycobacteriales bacterium]|nr:Calx-beta domain-containing protein [Mycobacteriales bacterium]